VVLTGEKRMADIQKDKTIQRLTTMITGEITDLYPVNTYVKIDIVEGKEVVRVTKDPKVQAVDEPTYAKLIDSDFKNGVIEVTVLSKLLEEAPDFARGFIGVAFRIDESNSKFEGFTFAQPMGEPMTSCAETVPHNISHILISSLIASGKKPLENMNHTQTWG
jgi:hypothetical protein